MFEFRTTKRQNAPPPPRQNTPLNDRMQGMLSRRSLPVVATLLLSAAPLLSAQNERHGRKYKAPPETSHLEILVVRDFNGKVIENAGVVFHPTKDGIDEGNLEVKSGPDGKAFIDIIPTGSDVQVQVIANGFETYAGDIKLDAPSKQLTVRMKRPTQQVSAYDENEGKGNLKRNVGVQEPIRTGTAPTTTAKPLSASEPVIKLPALPKSTNANGDATVQPGTTSAPASKQPTKTGNSAPVADGTTAPPQSN